MTCFVGRIFGSIASPIATDHKTLALCEALEADEDCTDTVTKANYVIGFQDDSNEYERRSFRALYTQEICDDSEDRRFFSQNLDDQSSLLTPGSTSSEGAQRRRTREVMDFSCATCWSSEQCFMISEDVRHQDDFLARSKREQPITGHTDNDKAVSMSDSDSSSPASPTPCAADKSFSSHEPEKDANETIEEYNVYNKDCSRYKDQEYCNCATRQHVSMDDTVLIELPRMDVPDVISVLGEWTIEDERDHLIRLGGQMEKTGKLSEALQFYEMCQELDVSVEASIVDSVSVYLNIGTVYWKMGCYQRSAAALNFVLYTYRDVVGQPWLELKPTFQDPKTSLVLAQTFLTLGQVKLSLGDTPEARRDAKHCLYIMSCSHLEHNVFAPVFARGLHCLGMTYEAEGRDSRALKYYCEALSMQEELYGSEHMDVAATLVSVGSLKEKMKAHTEAMKILVDALSIYETNLEENAPRTDVGVVLSKIGWICFLEAHYESALEAYDEATEIFAKSLGGRHRNVASVHVQAGMVHEQCGRHREALSSYRDALRIQRHALGDFHDDIAMTLGAIATSYESLGELGKAISYYDKALDVRRSMQGKNHIDVGITFSALGGLYIRTKKYYHARQCYTNALKILKANRIPTGDVRVQFISQSIIQVSRLQAQD